MRRQLFAILVLIVPSTHAAAGCIDPATLTHSTASVTRYFDDNEPGARPDLLGIRATGWFLSPTAMATAAHVTAAMHLSDRDWKAIEIRNGESRHSIPARVRHLTGSSAHQIAVVELQAPFSGAHGFRLRMESLAPEEPVVSLAYPGGALRVVGGRFVQYGDGERLAGTALFEMYDGDDRLVLDYGSSGAPVFDCSGRAVAIVDNLFTTTMQFMSRTIRISTAWGSPNVVAVPAPVLKDFVRAE